MWYVVNILTINSICCPGFFLSHKGDSVLVSEECMGVHYKHKVSAIGKLLSTKWYPAITLEALRKDVYLENYFQNFIISQTTWVGGGEYPLGAWEGELSLVWYISCYLLTRKPPLKAKSRNTMWNILSKLCGINFFTYLIIWRKYSSHCGAHNHLLLIYSIV